MNSAQARTVLIEAARLVELTATFQAQFGNRYVLKPGSPEEAWALYNSILNSQSFIAQMLDQDALQDLHHRNGMWWNRHDVMDVGTAYELVAEAGHLIGCCANLAASQPGKPCSYAVNASQMSIAGMLHPASLQIGTDEGIQLQAS